MLRHWRHFWRDERGAISPLMLVLFIGILLVTGIPMDMLKHEAERADLQAALDRGVLAAASPTQVLDKQAVVVDYVNKSVPPGTATSITVGQAGFAADRRIEASALHGMQTAFLGMVGLQELNVVAAAAAAQSSGRIEVSLVLDISSSMLAPNAAGTESKLASLKRAAKDFVDRVTEEGQDTLTTVNLVRFAGQVNAGPVMFDLMGGVRTHGESSCLELAAGDFTHTGLPGAGTYAQVPHFNHFARDPGADWGWCPGDGQAIVYASSDATRLKDAIDATRAHDGAGSHVAMKWALALLDPASQPVFQQLSTLGEIEPMHADLPLPWTEPRARKVVVLMSDGGMMSQFRPDDPADPRLADQEVVPNAIAHSETTSHDTGLGWFANLCEDAALQGVEVYTIGYEVPLAEQGAVRDCASSDGFFWDAQGDGIADAFSAVGSLVKNPRLVN